MNGLVFFEQFMVSTRDAKRLQILQILLLFSKKGGKNRIFETVRLVGFMSIFGTVL